MSIVYPHPMLHGETLDYVDPQAYKAEFRKPNENLVEVTHILKVPSLVAELVENGKAAFCCTVSVGGTSYRRTEMMSGGTAWGEKISVEQKLEIPEFGRSHEVFANAGVVLLKEVVLDWKEDYGLDDFHKGQKLHFQDYALLATSGWKRFYPSGALFRIEESKDMEGRTFRADVSYEPVLRVTIKMTSKLFDEVDADKEGTARAHVVCASLAVLLEQLHALYQKQSVQGEQGELDETESTNLEKAEGLMQYLKFKGIPTWDDQNFNPVEAASCYKPVVADVST